MGYARYVGRVGGLAVALGVGVAVATTPGVAWAGPSDPGSSSSSDSPSPDKTPDKTSSPKDSAPSDPLGSDAQSPSPSTSGDGDAGSPADGSDDAAGEDESKGSDDSEDSKKSTGSTVKDKKSGSDFSATVTSPKTPKRSVVSTPSDSNDVNTSEPAADTSAAVQPKSEPVSSPPATSDVPVVEVAPVTTSTVKASLDEPPVVSEPDAVEMPLASTLLSAVGLAPSADGDVPEVPGDSPLVLAGLAAFRRQTQQSLVGDESSALKVADPSQSSLMMADTTGGEPMMMAAAVNEGPSASPTSGAPDTVTGKVTGSLNAVDPEGDPLTHTVQNKTPGTTVSVDGSGNFTYTPSEAMRAQAATTSTLDTDTFTVRVSDGQTFTDVPVTVTVRPSQLAGAGPVDVGRDPSAVAVNGDGTIAYVANKLDKTVSVVDTSSGAVLSTINVPSSPTAVVVSPVAGQNRAYVAMTSGVAVIDTLNNRVVDLNPGTLTVDVIKVGSSPSAIAINPTGTLLYVSNGGSSTVSVVNTTTNLEITRVTVGSQPSGLAVSPDGTRVYALSRAADKVTVFRTDTNQVIGSATVGDSPREIALSPNGQVAYVSNYTSGTVTVLNTTEPTPVFVKTITVGTQPEGIAMSKDGTLVYVANGRDTVSVIDTRTNAVVGSAVTIDSPVEIGAHDIAVAGNKVFVTDYIDDWVRVLNVASVQSPPVVSTPTVGAPNAVTGTVNGSFTGTDDDTLQFTNTQGAKGTVVVTSDPYQAGVTAFNFTYTPTQAARQQAAQTPGQDFDTFTVTVSDGTTSTVRMVTVTVEPSGTSSQTPGTIPVGQLPTDVAISGGRAYVANWYDNTVSVIDTSTNTVTKTISVGGRPTSIAGSPSGSHMYVANSANNTVSVIDTASDTVVATVAVPTAQSGSSLVDLQVSSDGSKVYVTAWGGTVSVIDTTTRVVSGPYTVGPAASGIAVSPDGSRLYVSTELWNSNVIVVDANSMAVIDNIDIGEMYFPVDGSFTPDGKRLYLVTGAQGSVTAEAAVMVIDTDPTSTTYNSVIRTISAYELGSWFPGDVVFSPDGSRAYVSDMAGNTVSVIDTSTTEVIGAITTGPPSPSGSRRLAISPDGETLYITDQAMNVVRVVATDSVVVV